jgi:hypothetical protein
MTSATVLICIPCSQPFFVLVLIVPPAYLYRPRLICCDKLLQTISKLPYVHGGRIPRRFLASIRRPGRVGVEPSCSAGQRTTKVTPTIERCDQLLRDNCLANETHKVHPHCQYSHRMVILVSQWGNFQSRWPQVTKGPPAGWSLVTPTGNLLRRIIYRPWRSDVWPKMCRWDGIFSHWSQ